jgi:hypothetical protein
VAGGLLYVGTTLLWVVEALGTAAVVVVDTVTVGGGFGFGLRSGIG